MRKIFICALMCVSFNCFADTGDDCFYLMTQLHKMRARVIDIKYSTENKYLADQCKKMIVEKDSGVTVNMDEELGDGKFKIYVLEKYPEWQFWK